MKNRAKYEKELPHSFEDLIQQDLDYAHQYLLLFLEEIFDNNEIGEITDHIMGKKPLAEKNSKANYLKDRWKSIQSMIEMQQNSTHSEWGKPAKDKTLNILKDHETKIKSHRLIIKTTVLRIKDGN